MNTDTKHFQQTERLFHEILALPQTERAAALDKACAGDAAWRREMELLLAHAAPERDDTDLTASLRNKLADPGPDPEIGRHIGPYGILRRIGAGGMGGVYLARQTEPVQRQVAVKLIKRGLDSEETLRRFENERQVLAALNHANIAQLYDGGSTDDGRPYFVMEYVEGEPIDKYCDRHRLTTMQRLKLFQQVCAAVHFLHQNTIVHRDLKPANIQVSTRGIPKLLDFGIAKLTQPDGHSLETTRTDQRFMTLEYASPEQVRGDIITTASDVYTLGVILYELLSGHRPYESGDQSRHSIELAIRSDNDPPKPSEVVARRALVRRRGAIAEVTPQSVSSVRGVSADRLVRQLRSDLDNIVLKALRKDPAHRYVSADQLAADIERYLRNEPVLAAPPGLAYYATKFARRNKAACVLLLALILGLGGSITGAITASRAKDQALIAKQESQRQARQLLRAVYVKEMNLASMDFRSNAVASGKRRLRAAPADLRDWDWEYLNAISEDSLHVCEGHHGPVVAVAVSPDNRLGASASADATVRIWDLESGDQRHVLRGHGTAVGAVAFNPVDGRLASGGADGSVRLWNAEAGTDSSVLRTRGGVVKSIRYSHDGRWLAVGSEDRTLTLYDARTGDFVRDLRGYDGKSDSLAFTADDATIAAGGEEGALYLWDVATGTPRHLHKEVPFPVLYTSFSPDGQSVAVAGANVTLRVYDTDTWSRSRAIPGSVVMAAGLAFSPDSRTIIACAREPTAIRCIDLATRKVTQAYRGHEGPILALAASPDNKRIITGSSDATVRIWPGPPEAASNRRLTNADSILAMTFSPDGRLLATSSRDGATVFWDAQRRTQLRRIRSIGTVTSCLSFSHNSQNLASGERDGQLILQNSVTAEKRWSIPAHTDELTCLAFAPDDSWIVTGGRDGMLRLWETKTGTLIRTMTGHGGAVATLAVAPDGRQIFSAGADAGIRIWDAKTGAQSGTLLGRFSNILHLAVSPSGHRLVSTSSDRCLRLLNLTNGGSVVASVTLDTPVRWTAFSPNGRRFVSAGMDQQVQVWDCEAGSEILTFRDHRLPVSCAMFSPDGRTLVSAGRDPFIIFRDAIPYPTILASRRSLLDQAVNAELLVTSLRNRLGDWELVAETVQTDAEMSEPTRREALNRILTWAETPAPTPADWNVTFFPFAPTNDLQELTRRWNAAKDGPKAVKCQRRLIDFNWDKDAPAAGISSEYFGAVAEAVLNTSPGRHLVETRSDDGVQVSIDGRRIINNWTPHALTLNRAEIDLSSGPHTIRVSFFQTGGAAQLRFILEPMPSKAPASATSSTLPESSKTQPISQPSTPASLPENEPDEPLDDADRLPFGG